MLLTERLVAHARPHPGTIHRLNDGHGLYLLLQPHFPRTPIVWRFDYRFAGRRKSISFGPYPVVTLARAREKHADARDLLARGIDPSVARERDRQRRLVTFREVATEWLAQQRRVRAPRTINKLHAMLTNDLLPALGRVSIVALEPLDVLGPLRRIEARGCITRAHEARALAGAICRYAVATGRADRDVVVDLAGALTPVSVTHYAALTAPAAIGRLLQAIDGDAGSTIVRAALQVGLRVFVRPGELRAAEWTEIDLTNATWRIPAVRMKMAREHLVPLARQVVNLLQDLQTVTGAGRFVFPSPRDPARPISPAPVWKRLRRLAGPEQSLHGFRTIASTRLNELGWDPRLIELQLAHRDRNPIRGAYDRSVRLEERRGMMQAYADHLDVLRLNPRID